MKAYLVHRPTRAALPNRRYQSAASAAEWITLPATTDGRRRCPGKPREACDIKNSVVRGERLANNKACTARSRAKHRISRYEPKKAKPASFLEKHQNWCIDNRERKCADTIGTVLVPWAGAISNAKI